MTPQRSYSWLAVVLACLLALSLLINHHELGALRSENDRLKTESAKQEQTAIEARNAQERLEQARDTIKAQRAVLQKTEAELRRYKYEKPATLPVTASDMQRYWERFRTDNRP